MQGDRSERALEDPVHTCPLTLPSDHPEGNRGWALAEVASLTVTRPSRAPHPHPGWLCSPLPLITPGYPVAQVTFLPPHLQLHLSFPLVLYSHLTAMGFQCWTWSPGTPVVFLQVRATDHCIPSWGHVLKADSWGPSALLRWNPGDGTLESVFLMGPRCDFYTYPNLEP